MVNSDIYGYYDVYGLYSPCEPKASNNYCKNRCSTRIVKDKDCEKGPQRDVRGFVNKVTFEDAVNFIKGIQEKW